MALSLQITKPSGAIVSSPLTQSKSTVSVVPGDKVRIVDTATGKSPLNLRAKKIGDALVVENLPDGQVVEISNFYSACSPAQPCSVIVDAATAGADATVITQGTQPVALLGNGQSLIYGADPTGASLAPAATGAAAGASTVSPLLVVGGLVGVGAIAAAAGGGGGGGDDPVAPTATAPVIASHNQTASGLTVTGTAAPNTTVFVTLANGTPHQVTSDASGNWTTTFTNAELPAAGGTVALGAYVQDASGNRVPATSGGGDIAVTPPGGGDPGAPDAPIITAPTADAVVGGATATEGLIVSGTAAPGSTIAVTWGTLVATATADGDGRWSAQFDGHPADGASTLSATATDAGNRTSAASAPVAVMVDTVGPAVTSAAVDVHGAVSGTVPTDAVSVVVSDGSIQRTATVGAGGSFSVRDPAFESATSLTVVAFDAAGNAGTASTPTAPTTVNVNGSGVAVGGLGSQIILGGAGADVLIGGADSGVRNGQFEYWNVLSGGGFAPSADGYGLLSLAGSADQFGWVSATTGARFTGGATPDVASGNALDTWAVDHAPNNQLMGNFFDNTANGESVINVVPWTADGGHHAWNANFDHHQGGSGLSQTILTATGQEYSLAITVSGPASPATQTSFKVYFGGEEIASYDGVTGTWDETGNLSAPTGYTGALGATPQTWTWSVTATGGTSVLSIETYVNPDTAVNDTGATISSVALSTAGSDGADRLVGGAGRDILYGQAGDDVLYGGAPDETDTSGNAFVYTLGADNGSDVIRDFQVGDDRIVLIDVLDTDGTHGNPSDVPAPDVWAWSDQNLSMADLTDTSSPDQYLSVTTDSDGYIVIGFHGAGGASLGQVTLEGVTAADIGGSATLANLYSSNVIAVTTDGFSTDRLLEFNTGGTGLLG